jgi:hypothetical protein
MIMQKLHRDYQKAGLWSNLAVEEDNLSTFFCVVGGRDGLPLILNTASGKAEK